VSHIISIRRARRSDAYDIALLSKKEVEHGLPWQWTPRKLRRFLKHQDTNAYVAFCNGKLAGFSIASIGEARAHLVLLAVQPNWRRAGLGTQLLKWQLEAVQTAGINDMSLELRRSNMVARAFYQDAGFVLTRTVPGYYNKQEDALRYRLKPIRIPETHAG